MFYTHARTHTLNNSSQRTFVWLISAYMARLCMYDLLEHSPLKSKFRTGRCLLFAGMLMMLVIITTTMKPMLLIINISIVAVNVVMNNDDADNDNKYTADKNNNQ